MLCYHIDNFTFPKGTSKTSPILYRSLRSKWLIFRTFLFGRMTEVFFFLQVKCRTVRAPPPFVSLHPRLWRVCGCRLYRCRRKLVFITHWRKMATSSYGRSAAYTGCCCAQPVRQNLPRMTSQNLMTKLTFCLYDSYKLINDPRYRVYAVEKCLLVLSSFFLFLFWFFFLEGILFFLWFLFFLYSYLFDG